MNKENIEAIYSLKREWDRIKSSVKTSCGLDYNIPHRVTDAFLVLEESIKRFSPPKKVAGKARGYKMTDFREKARVVIESINRFRATVIGGYDYKDMEGPVDAIAAALAEVAEEATADHLNAVIDLANIENAALRDKIRGLEADVFVGAKIDGDECLRLIQDLQAKLADYENVAPEDPEVKEALRWADQPLDRVIDKDRPALEAFHVLARALRAKTAALREAEAISAGRLRVLNEKAEQWRLCEIDLWNVEASLTRRTEERDAYLEAVRMAEAKIAASVPRSRYDVACDQYNECEKERKRLFDRCKELEAKS